MTLEQRVRKLERENRWMRRIAGVAVAVVAVVVLVGQGKEEKLPDLEVRSLTLRDAAGKCRASLQVLDNGTPFLGLLDKDGKTRRIALGMLPDGSPILCLYGEGENPLLEFKLGFPGRTPVLTLYDKDGKYRTALEVTPEGAPAITLFDKEATPRMWLGTGVDGTPHIRLRDNDGIVRASLETSPDGTPCVAISDAKGSVIWQAPR